ncbi:MAG: type II secretion system protein GspM [Gemmatimonadota bacterium]
MFDRLSGRERRTIVVGGVVAVLLLLVFRVAFPVASRWNERETRIEAQAEQLARVEARVATRAELRATLDSLEARREATARRLIDGNTAALAASSLQSLINGYALRSGVSVIRIDSDVDRGTDGDEIGLIEIPLRLSARGDIWGLVDLLFYIENGEKLLVIDELSVSGARSIGAERQTMSWTLRLHGLFAPAREDRGETAT